VIPGYCRNECVSLMENGSFSLHGSHVNAALQYSGRYSYLHIREVKRRSLTHGVFH
jgi:hypothetical protein